MEKSATNQDQMIEQQLRYTIDSIDLEQVAGELNKPGSNTRVYSGKVRECLIRDGLRILIATDRLSCFDVIVSTIPFKGQVLTELANFWFKKTSQIVPNHLVSRPHSNVVLGRECEMLPIEVVVRRYLSGSLYKDYISGNNSYDLAVFKSAHSYSQYERFPELQITPTTKAAKGDHDLPISEEQINKNNVIPQKIWERIKEIAFALFTEGEKFCAGRGLILADTKYEFGLLKGEIVLADEVHTLDCARYWDEKSYHHTLKTGEAPQMLDKQVVREWFLSQGFSGEGVPPVFPDDQRKRISQLYINSYETITGLEFKPLPGDQKPAIIAAIQSAF